MGNILQLPKAEISSKDLRQHSQNETFQPSLTKLGLDLKRYEFAG